MTIFDAHTHIYPDAIALKAAGSIGEFYEMPICLDGTLGTLLQKGQEAGISRFLVHGVAITWERAHAINDYLMTMVAAHPDQLVGFGAIHPDAPELRAELLRIKAGGLVGVKVHPDFQRFHLDEPKAIALFEQLAELSMPLMAHTGDFRHPYSQPRRMAQALRAVPELKVICAHFGGWSVWEESGPELAGLPNLWVDSSSSLYALSPEKAVQLIRRFGADRVFFGTDYPMWNPVEEVARFLALPLTQAEQEGILHRNLADFLAGLD